MRSSIRIFIKLLQVVALVPCACLPLAFAQIPAFPGAEGAGATATGGRGQEIYHVTNLDESGPGSLVDALSQSNRLIVFDVSGVITLNTPDPASGRNDHFLRVGKSNITIAGQTAPGNGIVIQGTGTKFTGDNVVARNLSIRPGGMWNGRVRTMDSLWLQTSNSIFDHISSAWASDEGVSSSDAVDNTTVQYSIIAEGLLDHSYGAIIGPDTPNTVVSYHHNLISSNRSRNPRLGNELGAVNTADFRYNVVYNQRSPGYSGADQEGDGNFVGNYYVAGPNTSSGALHTAFEANFRNDLYQSGNRIDGTRDGVLNGVNTGWGMFDGTFTKRTSPLPVPSVTEQTADEALETVLDYSGAHWWQRTTTDARLVSEARSFGTQGQQIYDPSEVGGWPTEASLARDENWDIDRDGMPGWWEEKHGLDPYTANNNADFDNDGYTDVEEYINEIAAWPAPKPIEFTGTTSNRYALIENWGNVWQPSRFDMAVVADGTAVVDAVGQHAGTIQIAPQSGQIAALNITSGWLEVATSLEIATAGSTGQVNLTGGKLRVETLLKGSGGTFNFTGGILSADTVGFDLVNNGGTIAPGESPGTSHVEGDLTINTGALQVELGGAGLDDFDRLVIDGSATLGGDLDVSLLEGFALEPNSIFEILDISGSRFGEFAGLSEGALVGNFGENLYVTYSAGDGNDVALYTIATIAGDFNNDGSVDGYDFLAWQRDSSIGNLADWKANFGTAPQATASISVPEPATLLFAGICLLLTINGRRTTKTN